MLELYLRDGAGGAATVTTASTLAVYSADSTAIVPAGTPITSVGSEGQAQYSLAAVPAATDYSTDWAIDWELVDSNGFIVPITQSAHLVKSATHPVIDGNTLLQRHPRIVSNKHYTLEQINGFTVEAWIEIDSWLRRDGLYLEEFLEASALGPPHQKLSLSFMFADMAKAGNEHYASERDRYYDLALLAFNTMDGKSDTNQDAVPDGRIAVVPIWGGPWAKVAGGAR